jgi:hypothetical protein
MVKKYPLQFVLTLVLFLTINFSYFWEGEFGIFTFPIFIILFILYFLLSIEFIRQIYISFRDKFFGKTKKYTFSLYGFLFNIDFNKNTRIN